MPPIITSLLDTDLYKFTMWQAMLHRHPQTQAYYEFVCRNTPHYPLADLLLVAGEASSHCVRATTEHLLQHLPSGRPERIVLVTDCMSPVAGFEAQHQVFLASAQAQGVQLKDSSQISL